MFEIVVKCLLVIFEAVYDVYIDLLIVGGYEMLYRSDSDLLVFFFCFLMIVLLVSNGVFLVVS